MTYFLRLYGVFSLINSVSRPIKYNITHNADVFILGREKVRVQIIFQSESDVEKTIDILNSLMDEINAGLSGIEFIVARKGSIVLNVDITLDMFETDSRLQSIIVFFLERILECIATNTNKSIDTVLIIEEGLLSIYIHFC